MTTLQEAAQKAIELFDAQWQCSRLFSLEEVQDVAEELRSALAQQGEQQPVCYGCGIPAGDVHMSTCKSGKWPSRVSNGDTAAPVPQPAQTDEKGRPMTYWGGMAAPQAQQGEPVAQARLGMKDGLAMALSVVELYGMKGDVIYREIAKLRDGIAAAPAPQAQQGEPVYQYQMANGSWIDQIKDSYDYNRKYAPNATVRVVYTAAPAPQPAKRPRTAVQGIAHASNARMSNPRSWRDTGKF